MPETDIDQQTRVPVEHARYVSPGSSPRDASQVRRPSTSLIAVGIAGAAAALAWGWQAFRDAGFREQTRKRLEPRPRPAPPSAADIKVG